MSVSRYYTIGAIAPNLRSLKGLAVRLDALDPATGSVVVLTRRRDERLARVLLPEAHVKNTKGGLSRRQWLEFASAFFSASTVSFLMGAVHLWTGLIVQAVLTLAAVIGLVVYHRRSRVEKALLGYGMPEKLAGEWGASFSSGFALLLVTVTESDFEEAQDAFLEDDTLISTFAVDRRAVT